jgi:predicted dehydrogenase
VSLTAGIGLLGLGRWGRNYVKTLRALPECRLVALADTDRAVRDQISAETGIRVRASAEELLSEPAVEAVVIATPDRTHCSLASAALAAGRDVLVEKPMALEPDEAEALSGQAESGGRVLAVGHTAVYQTGLAELATEIGTWPPATDRLASAVRTSSGYTAVCESPSAGRQSAVIFDLCPHDIALAVLLFGIPVAARAQTDRQRVEYEVRFAHGAVLKGLAEWRQPPHIREFRVANALHVLGDKAGSSGRTDVRDTPLGRQCLDFIASCRTRRPPQSSGTLGAHVVRCLGALTASARSGGDWLDLGTPETAASTAQVAHSGPAQTAVGARG